MTKENKLSPIQAGSFPENELSLRFKNDNIVQFRNDPGIPKKLLLLKSSTLSSIKEPKDLGISPEKLLLAKFRTITACHCMKQSGRAPNSWLSERSR